MNFVIHIFLWKSEAQHSVLWCPLPNLRGRGFYLVNRVNLFYIYFLGIQKRQGLWLHGFIIIQIIMLPRFGQKHDSRMSIEKSVQKPQKTLSLQKRMPQNKLAGFNNVQGVNMTQQTFAFDISKPQDGSVDNTISKMWNIPSLPNQKGRFLEISAFFTFLLNYADADIPTSINLHIQQLQGSMNKDGSFHHIVSRALPKVLSTTINPGGIIGYNVLYGLGETSTLLDISHVNTLTLRLRLDDEQTSLALPLLNKVLLQGKLIRIVV